MFFISVCKIQKPWNKLNLKLILAFFICKNEFHSYFYFDVAVMYRSTGDPKAPTFDEINGKGL